MGSKSFNLIKQKWDIPPILLHRIDAIELTVNLNLDNFDFILEDREEGTHNTILSGVALHEGILVRPPLDADFPVLMGS